MNMPALVFILAAISATAESATPVGNGRLTALVDDLGRVAVCRWPGPATNDQVGAHGLSWDIGAARKSWFSEARIRRFVPEAPAVAGTLLTSPKNERSAAIQTFVTLDKDVLATRVTVTGLQDPPDLFWTADFSPRTRMAPELAQLDGVPQRDFAVYAGPNGRVYHFRPDSPGRKQWAAAEGGHWDEFAESRGVWIVYGSREATAVACGPALEDAPVPLAPAAWAMGDCASTLRMRGVPDGGSYAATVFAAFGATRAEAEAALEYAIETGYDTLLAQTTGYWSDFISRGTASLPPDAPSRARLEKDLLLLGLCLDRATGAFCRDPAGDSTGALCYPRDCAWAQMALDSAGYAESAERMLTFLASAVRKEQRRGKPMGSLAIAYYGNGVEALPHLALDAGAPAYALGAMWRHAASVPDEARCRRFLEQVWDSTVLMADFLAGWTDGRNREPLYSFDCASGSDQQRPDRLLIAYMGMDAALRIASALHRPEPEPWARRKVELDALIRFQLVNRDTGAWMPDPVLPYWHELMAEDWAGRGPALPAWDAAIEEMLKTAPTAEAAASAALVWRGNEQRARQVADALENAYALPSDANAREAACRIVATLKP